MREPLVAPMLAVAMLPVAAWAQVPRGPEFLVNTYTTHTQAAADVAVDGAGNSIVSWNSYGQDGDIAFTEAPTRRVAAIVLRRLTGAYAVMGRARLDDNVQADTGFFPISDAPHVIEFDLQPASAPDAEDGSFELRVDGVPQAVITGLDNSLARVDLGRLGALSVKSGAAGTLYWDEFDSWRVGF
jgi:hypothetical protein